MRMLYLWANDASVWCLSFLSEYPAHIDNKGAPLCATQYRAEINPLFVLFFSFVVSPPHTHKGFKIFDFIFGVVVVCVLCRERCDAFLKNQQKKNERHEVDSYQGFFVFMSRNGSIGLVVRGRVRRGDLAHTPTYLSRTPAPAQEIINERSYGDIGKSHEYY